MSFIPFGTAWVGSYPVSFAPLYFYFSDMAFACFTFHQLCYLIHKESGNGEKFKPGPRSIISLITYTGAALFGGFCPIAAYIIVAVVSLWWIFPDKRIKEQPRPEKEDNK